MKFAKNIIGLLLILGSIGGIILYREQNTLPDFILAGILILIGTIILLLKSHTKDYIKTSSKCTYSTDDNRITNKTGKEYISNEDVQHLIQSDYENALKYEQESSNPKFHRTEYEENLSSNFAMKYGKNIYALTNKFEESYRDAFKTKDLSRRIQLLQQSVESFERAKKFCYSKGKGGTLYFQDMYEHLHNGRKECFSYLENIQDSLNETIREKDYIIPTIMKTIQQNDSILQKDLYAFIPDVSKSDIQRLIRELESENQISRLKKSNSYELHTLSQ